jgi:FkbM family methyltransferase
MPDIGGRMWGQNVKPLPFNMVVRDKVEMWRAADFWMKEPETILWMQSFETNSVFWDIGANIGVYSLFAESLGHRVYAFEPCADNFERLFLNRSVNYYKMQAFPFAFGDTCRTAQFSVPKRGAGLSGGQIGEARDEMGRKFEPECTYEVEVKTIDELSKTLDAPDYIKIDVDGIEPDIIAGAVNTIVSGKVKSVLVEESKKSATIKSVMERSGFSTWNQFNAQDINRRLHNKKDPRCNVIYTRPT